MAYSRCSGLHRDALLVQTSSLQPLRCELDSTNEHSNKDSLASWQPAELSCAPVLDPCLNVCVALQRMLVPILALTGACTRYCAALCTLQWPYNASVVFSGYHQINALALHAMQHVNVPIFTLAPAFRKVKKLLIIIGALTVTSECTTTAQFCSTAA